MNTKREVGIKVILSTMFVSSMCFSMLWMAGYLDDESMVPFNQNHSVKGTQNDHNPIHIQKKEPAQEDLSDDEKVINPLQESTSIKGESNVIEQTYGTEQEERNLEIKPIDENHFQIEQVSSQWFEAYLLQQLSSHADDNQMVDQEEIKSAQSKRGTVKAASVNQAEKQGKIDLPSLEARLDLNHYPVKKVTATGYTAGYESTGKHPDHPEYGITYSGVQVRRDLYSTIAADTSVFPIGTVLYIPDYGFGVVADIGGAIKGNKIDLYFETVDDVFRSWGKKQVDVYVIREGDGQVSEAFLDQLNQQAIQVTKNEHGS